MECNGCAEWLAQIIRGPRPKSVQWPKACAQLPQRSPAQQIRQSVLTGSGVGTFSEPVTRDSVEAAAEVKQLEAAIGVLAENNVHTRSPCTKPSMLFATRRSCHQFRIRWSLARVGPSNKRQCTRQSGRRGSQTRGSPCPGNEPTTSCSVLKCGVPKISHKWMGQGPPSLGSATKIAIASWGATQLGHLGQDVPMQDHTKSSMMSSLIDGSACGPTQ